LAINNLGEVAGQGHVTGTTLGARNLDQRWEMNVV
jgi:hypothetical protein